MSIEATLPALPDGRAYTFAESYVLLGSDEALRDLVGEQYGKLPSTEILCLTHEGSLVLHDPEAGFVFEGPLMQQIKTRLLTKVRAAVRGVDPEELEEVDGLDKSMVNRLGKLSEAASKVNEPRLKCTLVARLQAMPAKVLTLDAQPGILNLRGPNVAVYDRKTAPKLVARDPALHHVHRTTGVDCAWLEETLPPDMQAQYDQFATEQLGRWFVNGEACSYFLCATGDALFGGDTTRIKSSLLLIGEPDQAKSSMLDTAVAAGGWEKPSAGRKKNVSTSHAYAFGGADPNALLAKSSKDTLRNAMLKAVDGIRLVKFNELEATDVWRGVKGLSNKEEQSITKKKQSSGATTIDLIETPYALLSTNKPPPPPPEDVKTKVAVITPAMLGRFVDGDGDGVATFPKVQDLDCSTFPGPMLRAMWLELKAHYEAHPGEPFDHEKHLPECMREARDDPATWASGSGGASASGAIKPAVEATITPEDKATVVEEIKGLSLDPSKKVVALRSRPKAKGQAEASPSLMDQLTRESLLLLGAEDDDHKIEQARNSKSQEAKMPWLAVLFANLKSCLIDPDGTFPGYLIQNNTTGRTIHKEVFTGEYVEVPAVPQE